MSTTMAMPTTTMLRGHLVFVRFPTPVDFLCLTQNPLWRVFQRGKEVVSLSLLTNLTDDVFVYGRQRCQHRSSLPMNLFDNAVTLEALYEAFQLSKKGSDWKASIQRFEMNLLRNICNLRKELLEGTYQQMPFYEFTLSERGKTRHIRSMHIRDRVVQRTVCDNILIPALYPYLIYDNGASIKGKGISFTRNRLQCHLEKFIRRHGVNGWILQIDYSKFFDNIPHDRLIDAIADKIDDPRAMLLIETLINSFAVNVGHLTDEEADRLDYGVFNSVGFKQNPNPKPTDRHLHKSLGIGSQISQIAGIFYLNPVDTYCKTVRSCKYYGRYMDDIYVIHHDKEFLKDLLENIVRISTELGLTVNRKKTQIHPLKRGFTFLQIKCSFTSTGRIIKRLTANKVTRERRKLKAYNRLLAEGRLTGKEVSNAYQSWRGNLKPFNCHNTLRAMDRFYNQTFLGEYL